MGEGEEALLRQLALVLRLQTGLFSGPLTRPSRGHVLGGGTGEMNSCYFSAETCSCTAVSRGC